MYTCIDIYMCVCIYRERESERDTSRARASWGGAHTRKAPPPRAARWRGVSPEAVREVRSAPPATSTSITYID